MKKKILVRGFFNYNFGDDLFTEILLERYPNTDFLIIAPKEYAKVWNKHENVSCVGVPVNLFQRVLARLLRWLSFSWYQKYYCFCYNKFYKSLYNVVDGLVILGGSMFKENVNTATENLLADNILQVFEHKPCYVIGANFGPFKSTEFYNFYKKHFAKYKDVCFRDSYSQKLFCGLPNVRCEKDLVFQLKSPGVAREPKTMGIVVVNFKQHKGLCEYFDKYKNLIHDIINQYSDKGFSIKLICFQMNEESYVESLVAMHDNLNIEKFVYKGDMNNFLLKYASLSTIYATRFHSMIISMILGQKFCPIIYDQKMDRVLDDLRYRGIRVHLNNMTISEDDFKVIDNMNFLSIADHSKSAQMQFQELDLFLNPKIV